MELEKMKLASASGSELNLEALYQIMPSAFTEVRDEKTGEITHKINFSTLRELLGDNAYDEADEEYGFKWVGKNAARREAARSINKTLRPCPEDSVDWENTQNLYIEGDNLEVLKLLQKSYLGKIKMIYIDPPYNTGNDFVYRDDFAMDKDGYDRAAGDVDELGNRFRKNADGNARFHSDWCSMIYERLLVARALLSNDGVIFISIDDNEVDNLRKICDEIFGGSNFVAQFPWRKRTAKSDVPFGVSQDYEWIICYAKSNNFVASVEGNERKYYETPDFPNRPWRVHDLTKQTTASERPNSYFTIINPKTGEEYPASPNRTWAITKETFEEYYAVDRIVFPNDYDFLRISKPVLRYWKEDDMKKAGDDFGRVAVSSKLPDNIGMSQDGTKEVTGLFDGKIFSFPKPSSLIHFFAKAINSNDALILDFFSGSATTAHAVMQLNAEDGGNRRYIMVQLPEETEAGSEAYKAGYKNICEIGKERIRRAGKKIKEEFGEKAAALDTGFRVFKCEDSFMNDVYFSPAELQQQDLFAQISNIKDGTSDLSMLFGCMLDWGVQLSLPLSTFEVAGKTIYNVNDGDLVACFNENVNEDAISAIAELNPLRVVFRDSCFGDAPLKMNLFELFKQKCGWSEEVVKSRVHVI